MSSYTLQKCIRKPSDPILIWLESKIDREPNITKSNRLHVDVLRFPFLSLEYVLNICKCESSWTWTRYISNSTCPSHCNNVHYILKASYLGDYATNAFWLMYLQCLLNLQESLGHLACENFHMSASWGKTLSSRTCNRKLLLSDHSEEVVEFWRRLRHSL